MKTFEFSKTTTKKIVNAFNNSYFGRYGCIDDVMALSTIQKCYGTRGKVHVFKTYRNGNCYAFYDDDNKIVTFDSEKETYEFILGI